MKELGESGLAEAIAQKSEGWRAVFAGDINVRQRRCFVTPLLFVHTSSVSFCCNLLNELMPRLANTVPLVSLPLPSPDSP